MIYSIKDINELTEEEWKELEFPIKIRKSIKKLLDKDVDTGIKGIKLRDPVSMERSLYIVLFFVNSAYTD